jgi:alginate O-acetyltransferase complex protein AlgI
VIADNLTAGIEFWHQYYGSLSIAGRWEMFGALALRILMDFSGYSDIAIGLARMMGIRLPENFNWPYFSTSLQEFWHRWHISLSSWIRDYVYIPLGGNRHGIVRKILNGLVAFSLCGLWHGPAWNFVCWGVYHGVGLAISSNYQAALGAPGRWLASFLARSPFVGWILTTAFVFVGWLYFFYPLGEATRMLRLLFVQNL